MKVKMRKAITLSCLLFCALWAQAQQISQDTEWYDGNLNFHANRQAGGKILMQACAEGEELEFVLVPVAGASGKYTVKEGPNDVTIPNDKWATARYLRESGWDLLCLYDRDNRLHCVMQKTDGHTSAEKLSVSKWITQTVGEYTTSDGKVTINWERLTVNGVEGTYKVNTFNDLVTGIITIEGTRLAGVWDVVPTLDGLILNKGKFDEYGMFQPGESSVALKESSPRIGRFAYANSQLLNDRQFNTLKKSTLRIMRNAIMAQHGYVFKSQDLIDYFSREPWYKPAASNSGIKLSIIEQLNVDLIKCEEEKADSERYVKEP